MKKRGDAAVPRTVREIGRVVAQAAFRLSKSEIESLVGSVASSTIDDIKFAQTQVARFAESQKSALRNLEIETIPGVLLGHRNIPVGSVACYVPGGRYPDGRVRSHECAHGEDCRCGTRWSLVPPPIGGKPYAETIAAMSLAGADEIYVVGGVQAIAAFALGTQSIAPVDMSRRSRECLRC